MSALNFVAAKQRERASGTMQEMNEAPKPKRRYSKGGRKALGVWVDPKVIQQVKIIAAEKMVQQQEILAEFLNDGFLKYGKPPCA